MRGLTEGLPLFSLCDFQIPQIILVCVHSCYEGQPHSDEVIFINLMSTLSIGRKKSDDIFRDNGFFRYASITFYKMVDNRKYFMFSGPEYSLSRRIPILSHLW